MRKPKRQKITIEKLAEMTQRGFTDIEGRIDKRVDSLGRRMDEGFGELRDGFQELSKALQQLAKSMEEGFRHVNARLDTLREDISDLPEIRQGMRDLEARVTRLERKVGTAK